MKIERLVWDNWNALHIARHHVTPDQFEEVCQGDPLIQVTYAGRFLITGPTSNGTMFSVVLEPEDDQGTYTRLTPGTPGLPRLNDE